MFTTLLGCKQRLGLLVHMNNYSEYAKNRHCTCSPKLTFGRFVGVYYLMDEHNLGLPIHFLWRSFLYYQEHHRANKVDHTTTNSTEVVIGNCICPNAYCEGYYKALKQM